MYTILGCTRICTRIFGLYLAIYDIARHTTKGVNAEIQMICDFMAFYKIGVISAPLSAINIDFQCFTKLVHEYVHETPCF